jgi:ribosomal protein S18 acetylase RimI-like enzyme/heat shock protein HslJ
MTPVSHRGDDVTVVGLLSPPDLPEVATFVAAQQADPTRHIAYLGTDAGGIAAELEALEPLGLAGVLVARRGAELVGMLAADWSDDPPRVWWFGPFVTSDGSFDAVADALLRAARALLPAEVTQEEVAVDRRNEAVSAFAQRHGFEPGEGSALITSDLSDERLTSPSGGERGDPRDVLVEPLDDRTRGTVAALHDRLFPGTHTPGDRLDREPDRIVLVATRDGAVLGYVAAERQPDGAGYVDFLGVDEPARGEGIGRRLVLVACRRLRDDLGCSLAHLTVQESNVAARRLYTSLGFVEERVLYPWRRGLRGSPVAADAVPEPPDLDRSWTLVSGHGPAGPVALIADHPITLVIEGDRWAGNAGCNQYTTTVARDSDRVTVVDGIATTLMACSDALMAVERAYLAAFPAIRTVELADCRLALRGTDTELVFEPTVDGVETAISGCTLRLARATGGAITCEVAAAEG